MKILFLVAYSELGASSRIKVYQFLPLLNKKGINCKTICFMPSFLYRLRLASASNNKLLLWFYFLVYIFKLIKSVEAILIATQYDAVYIQEPLFPFGLEKVLKLVNKNIVFLFTDAVFLGGRKSDSFIERLRAHTLAVYWKRTARIAKYCLVENEYNKSAVIKFCPNVEKIAGPMDLDVYFLRNDLSYKKENNKIVVGWMGSYFTTKYLYNIKDVFLELSKKYDIIFRLVGAKKDFQINGVCFENIDFKLSKEIEWLSTFDIGIMPLTDDDWTRGKGGYKLLQYMSMGIPAVASPVGINKEITEDGVNGFLASSKEEWVSKLSLLIENSDLRKKLGKNARITIEQKYSLKIALEKLLKVFNKVNE